MKLDNFTAVFRAAQEVALKGESLICIGHDKTIAIRPINSEALPQIEIAEIDGSNVKHSQRFDNNNFPVQLFTQLRVAPQYLTLLTGGANVIGK